MKRTSQTSLEAGISASENFATLQVLGQQGMVPEDLHAIRANENIAKEVVRCVRKLRIPEHEIDNMLIAILESEHFFGPRDWEVFFDIKLTSLKMPDLQKIAKILTSPYPFGDEETARDNYFLYCLPPESTIRQYTKMTVIGETLKFPNQEERGFWGRTYVEKTIPRWTWYLAHLGVIPESWNKIWKQQISMVPPNHFVPLACEYVLLPLFHYLKTGINFNFGGTIYGRLADLDKILSNKPEHVGMMLEDACHCLMNPFDEKPFDDTGILACWDLTA